MTNQRSPCGVNGLLASGPCRAVIYCNKEAVGASLKNTRNSAGIRRLSPVERSAELRLSVHVKSPQRKVAFGGEWSLCSEQQ
ncbi:hypothetical protein Q5P01_022296 [Channa striata]|uniref:Uncharacterized protein n=1 Tax=Channa striata TaxID=64152 RepID=A0AA88IZE6_CHASR|nr:hypothetical protein Q5P01_022296 [Channa striata]